YASLLVTVQGGSNYITVIEPAGLPTKPISPNVPQMVLLAAAIGLALAVGGAFLIEYMDDTVRTPEEATRATGLPLMAEIGRLRGEEYAEKLVTLNDPLSPISEAYRGLRTSIRFASVDRPLRTLMIASPGPAEGKSITLANLAIVFAQAGVRVLVVDTDLRRPVQHRIFNVPNTRGISELFLSTDGHLADYIQPTSVENLSLLNAGQPPPNPSELLASERLGEIILELLREADLVLLDSPPSMVVADALILGSRVDGVLMVNDLGTTHRKIAAKAAEELKRAQANLLGVVLNRVPPAHAGYYYYHYGYYYRRDEDGTRRRTRRSSSRSWAPRWLRHLLRGKRGHSSDESASGEAAPTVMAGVGRASDSPGE
ncbi:MAG: polysaccharide biosynthesis tyrosine autokinase, partial [Chloroflexota bacterium]